MTEPVAILYQAQPPPEIDGIRKPFKEGGYADSGADIAYVLRAAGVPVVTPAAAPAPARDLDWVFPDTGEGIARARAAGARILWANTILFSGHPLSTAAAWARIVGQRPETVQRFDDKWVANSDVRAAGCLVAAALLADVQTEFSDGLLARHGLRLPLVVKPVRGRGSQGVSRVDTAAQLKSAVAGLLAARIFGNKVIVEEFLDGDEITITVMPPGSYRRGGADVACPGYWTLPAVARFNHQDGIAPYSGVVAVMNNSRAMDSIAQSAWAVQSVLADAVTAARTIGSTAPIRIDCRQGADGRYRLFDLNLKPNMTGAGRPGRENRDSLTCLAARAIGWTYADLLLNMLRQTWTDRP